MTAQTKGVDVRQVFASARRVAHLCDPLARAQQQPESNSLEAQAFNLLGELDAAEAAIDELIEASAAMLPRNVCLGNSNVSDDAEAPLVATMGELRSFAAALARCRRKYHG